MKLRTKIAGTLALPLALAVAASTQAATIVDTAQHRLNIGGYVSAIATWNQLDDGLPGESGDNLVNDFGLGNSRLNFGYTNKDLGITFFYEQNLGNDAVNGSSSTSNLRRHAYLSTTDGWVAGWTWSFGGNTIAAGETIDTDGPGRTAWGSAGGSQARNNLIGKNFSLGDGLSVGVAIEEKVVTYYGVTPVDTAVPDIAVNFKGNFNGVQVLVAATQFNANVEDENGDFDDESFTRITAGAVLPLGDLTLRGGVTSEEDDLHFTAAVGYKFNDQLRANLVVEQNDFDGDTASSVWVNAFYKAANGIEWGGELQFTSVDDEIYADEAAADRFTYSSTGGALGDGGLAFRLQAKYAF